MNTEHNLKKTNDFIGKQLSHLNSDKIEFDSDYNVVGLNGEGKYSIVYASPNTLSFVKNGIIGQINGKDDYNLVKSWGLGQETYLAGWYPVAFYKESGAKGWGLNFIGFKNNEDRIKFNNYWKNIRDEIIRQHSK